MYIFVSIFLRVTEIVEINRNKQEHIRSALETPVSEIYKTRPSAPPIDFALPIDRSIRKYLLLLF